MSAEPQIGQEPVCMKTIGVLGGMSSQATSEYYRMLNAGINSVRGGWSAAELLIFSVNFANIEAFVRSEQWDAAAKYLVEKAIQVERGGADFIIMVSNTMHKVAPQIENAIHIPLIHIVDVAAEEITKQELTTVGVLGTKPVMEADFYQDRFYQHGIKAISPNGRQRQIIDEIIFNELVLGIHKEESRKVYVDIMRELAEQGVQGIVLGCTEIEMLVKPEDVPELPLFNTAALHCQKAVNLALGTTPLPMPRIYTNP